MLKKNIIIGLDIETNNSLDIENAQIVQLCLRAYSIDSENVITIIDELVKYYKPAHFLESESVNDIQNIIENMSNLEPHTQALEDFNDFILKHKENINFVFGHNILAFDLPILKCKLDIEVIDTLVTIRKLKYYYKAKNKFDYTSTSLVKFLQNNNIPYNTNAHDASNDVDNTLSLLIAINNTAKLYLFPKNCFPLKKFKYLNTIYAIDKYMHDIHKDIITLPSMYEKHNDNLNSWIHSIAENGYKYMYIKNIIPKLESHPDYEKLLILFNT